MRYLSSSVISFSIVVDGNPEGVRVSFSPHSSGGSDFFTENVKLVEALEKSPMFGKVYRRAPECVDVKVGKKAAPKAVAKKVKEVPEVTGWQDAVEYLAANCGSAASALSTPDAILKEAEAKGVKFMNLK